MTLPKIVMIDDDETFLRGYQTLLQRDYTIFCALTVEEGNRLIEAHRPEILLLDITMRHQKEGLEVLPLLRRQYPQMIIVVVTNWDSHLISKEAIQKGADDFFIKTEKHTLLKAMLENLQAAARQQDEALSADYPGLVVHARSMQTVLADARKVARLSYSVLISGESGSGKEVVARFIHDHSHRREGPFVAVNCAAIPESLFESELFGHERGSFTGASQTRPGWFEAAQKGTLFLDEVAELPVTKQATLLRVLQEKRIEHIGAQRSISLDIRFIAATNADLAARIRQKLFREDLYYRLADFEIRLPPLREREADILPLSHFFLEEAMTENGIGNKHFTQQALLVLKNHHWPGNVRELQRTIHRAIVRSHGRRDIRPTDLDLSGGRPIRPELSYDLAKNQAVEAFQRDFLKAAIVQNNGNISATARRIGISRQALQQLIERLQLNTE